MNIEEANHQAKRQALHEEWAKIIRDYETSGMSKAAFCRDHGLPIWKLQYWCKVFQKQHKSTTGFIELSPVVATSGSGIWVSCGRCRVHVDANFDSRVLCQVVEALS